MENQDETALKNLLERAVKARQRRLSKLKSLAVASERKAKNYVRVYFRCREVRIAGAYDAWRRNAQPKKGEPVPYAMIFEAAKALDMWKASSEPVLLRSKERPHGRRRYIPVRGIIEIARDKIAFEAAKPLTKFHPNQFGQKGLNQLHEWLQATLPKGQIVITTDIPSCYDTIKRSSVMRDMPLPKHVMKAVLIDTKERAVHLVEEPKGCLAASFSSQGDTSPSFVDAGPSCRGILTGSALAALASDSVIRHVLVAAEEAAPGVHAAAWGDNLIFLIEEAKDAARVFAAVEKAVADNFGFDVVDGLARRKQETALPGQFVFCGRWYKLSGGKLICKTDAGRLEAAKLKLAMLVSEAKTDEDFKKIEQVMAGYAIANRHTPSIIVAYISEAMKIGEKRVSILGHKLLQELGDQAETIEAS